MRINSKRKTSREFLKKNFPENIIPHKKLINKDKRYIEEKVIVLKRVRRRIKKVEDFLQKKYSNQIVKNFEKKFSLVRKKEKQRFLFSVDQIKNDLLGMQERNRPASDFLSKIKEKKKISIIYGQVSKKNFQRAYEYALRTQGKVSDNLILYFENRLDTIVFRINFAKTMQASRQLINHNGILVNGVHVTIPTYQVKPGDIISIDFNKKKKIADQTLKNVKRVVKTRRFRFFISYKMVQKKLGHKLYSLPSNKKWNKNRKKQTNLLYNSKKSVREISNYSSFSNSKIRKVISKLKRLLNKTERNNHKKRIWYLETMVRLNSMKTIVEKTNSTLNSKIEKYKDHFFNFQEKRRKSFVALTLKKLMYRKPSRYFKKFSLRLSSMKSINVEVSYKTMSAIVLYSPQKVSYPALLNVDMFSRALAKK